MIGRVVLVVSLSVLGASARGEPPAADAARSVPAAGAAAGRPAPPAMPPYQMRASEPPGARTSAGRDGRRLFSYLCGACHLPGGMGTNVLTQRLLRSGQDPRLGLLTARMPLPAELVESVVRKGTGSMPPLTRVDVTDAELDAIAGYLAGETP